MTAAELAAIDHMHHEKHGADLNPFSTEGARRDWQRGFDGVADEAQRMGWRTFTVRLASDALTYREVQCPASAEASGVCGTRQSRSEQAWHRPLTKH